MAELTREEKIKQGIKIYLQGEKEYRKAFWGSLKKGAKLNIIPWDKATGYFILPCHPDISFALNIYGFDAFECPICRRLYCIYIDFMLYDEPEGGDE